jgi:hypothetical protein
MVQPYHTYKMIAQFKHISRTAYGKTSMKQKQQIKCTSSFGMGEIGPMLGTYLSQEQNPGGYHGGC